MLHVYYRFPNESLRHLETEEDQSDTKPKLRKTYKTLKSAFLSKCTLNEINRFRENIPNYLNLDMIFSIYFEDRLNDLVSIFNTLGQLSWSSM